jgi:3-oxoacyl-[acyl-carrier-protein] synthase II
MKVFVTGMGVMTSLGNSVDEMFNGLVENRTGVKAYPEWAQHKGLMSHLGAPTPDYDISKIPRAARRSMSRMSEMATLATLQALAQANISADTGLKSNRALLCMGSTTGSPTTMETYFRKLFERGGPEGQLSTSFFKVMNHSVPANVASALGFHGPMLSPSSACATSAQAMIMGWELIKSGHYDMVIAGGADELHYTSSAIFDIVMAASRGFNDRPELAPRPFDRARDGLVVSEGASVVVLESEASVKARGARKIVEFCGGAYLCDGTHMSQSNAKTMSEVMNLALARCGRTPADVDYVSAHATGTLQGDSEEAAAIREVVGARVPVSSLKGHFGHSLAACGTLEVIASTKMMEKGIIIPTRNLDEIALDCAGIQHVQKRGEASLKTVLSNNFAFGGMSTSLVLSMESVESE